MTPSVCSFPAINVSETSTAPLLGRNLQTNQHFTPSLTSQQLQLQSSRTIGDTCESTMSNLPELPLVASIFIMTAIHLLSRLSSISFVLALIACLLSSIHIFILLLLRHNINQTLPRSSLSRAVSVTIITTTSILLVFSYLINTAPSSSFSRSYSTSTSPFPTPSSTVLIPHAAARLAARKRLTKGSDVSDLVNAVSMSMPNNGDRETEALENTLDETRGNLSVSSTAATLMKLRNATFVVSAMTSESCSAACARYHYVCSPRALRVINTCRLLRLRLPCSSCTPLKIMHPLAHALPAAVKLDAPQYQRVKGDDEREREIEGGRRFHKCFTLRVATDQELHCHVSAPSVKRLCPCIA